MGSIGIISLTTRRNRRFFISAEHYPVVKVRPTEVDLDDRCDSVVPSDPLVGGLPAGGRTLIKGSMASPTIRARGSCHCLGWTRDVRFVAATRSKVGGDEETRTPDPLLAKEMLYQLSYVPSPIWVVVGVSGLEPETSALSGQCSNQLS
jgi:hypothetical protein